MKKALSIILLLLFAANLTQAQHRRYTPEEYIEMYRDIAIAEMQRSGIPASIKLAQGILESGSGNSELSRKGNNHFGIKCRGDWKGRSMLYDDDEENECFRVYRNPHDSYRDHTEFLVNGYRYRNLFELDPTDYKGWARGLRQAGYATNPRYADLLINIIERYELHRYDKGYSIPGTDVIADERARPRVRSAEDEVKAGEVFEYNGIPAVIVRKGDTYKSISREHSLMRRQLARYNDMERNADLTPGEVLYLKPKRGRPDERYHRVAVGDDMRTISQLYGIRLRRLYRINRMDMREGEEPAAGEEIHLRRMRSEPPILRFETLEQNDKQVAETESPKPKTVEPEPKPEPESAPVIVNDADESQSSGDEIMEQANLDGVDDNIHIVGEEETLFSIARKYDMSVEKLARINQIEDYLIEIGQVIHLSSGTKDDKVVEITDMPDYHIVKQGETLFSISRSYGVSVKELMDNNGLDSTDISIGMRLQLPGSGQK